MLDALDNRDAMNERCCCRKILCGVIALMLSGFGLAHADYYVATNGNHISPYDDLAKAATNIQAAVTAAVDNATVWVSGGRYFLSADNSTVVSISDKSLALRGAGGNPADTIIDGANTNRGIYISMSTPKIVVIDSFTITNCTTLGYGAGVRLNHTGITSGTGIIQNCVIAGNDIRGIAAWYGGGGILSWGADQSAFLTVVSNCTIAGNFASRVGGGGASFYSAKVLVQDCHITGNMVTNFNSATGGGIRTASLTEGSLIKDCLIESNTAVYFGAGVYNTASGADLENCTIRGNYGPYGVGMYITGNSRTTTVRNCLISGNRATAYACGVMISAGSAILDNCTIVTNVTLAPGSGYGTGGFFQTGASSTSVVQNSVIYFNYGPSGHSNYTVTGSCSINYTCTAPLPAGTGNTSTNPLFVAETGSDFHLVTESPCINAGLNLPWMNGAKDLDNHTRVDIFSGKVDMGCYEYLPQGMMFKVQ